MPESGPGSKRSAEEAASEDPAQASSLPTAQRARENPAVKVVLQSGAYGNRGLKAALEDVELQVFDLAAFGPPALAKARTAFYAIFDGHAGRAAAEFCEEHLLKIAAHISAPGDNDVVRKAIIEGFKDNDVVRKAIIEGFKDTDAAFLAETAEKGLRDGCTAVTATIVDDTLFVGWVGDSKAVLARRESEEPGSRLKPLAITKDHNTMIAKERERVVKAGGFIENNRVNGIMEVTRSIGDRELKKAGVISTPDLQRITLCARDEFLLLACDGLWGVMTAQEAVEMTHKALSSGKDPREACLERQGPP
ncbi:phosphatase 2C-like domain-containing protein [Baffinella frigidus]|nr:phosphatase 2C-like domain-containing protein [Cryptophyta sp. CCMP2293]